MIRRILIVVLTVLLVAGASFGDEPKNAAGRDRGDLWFDVGEHLTYRIYWGVIPVGTTRVTTQWVEEDGREMIAIRLRTKTTSFMSRIYPVDDVIESIIDPETFLPVRFTKKLSEGRYRAHETTEFDHQNLKAFWKSHLNNKTNEIEIEPDTRDIVSFMYYMRSKQFEPDTETEYRVMADEKIYDLVVKAEEVEKVRVADFGMVDSIRLEPEASFEGLFVRKGRMWMWVSRDERRLCTKIEAKVPVASVTLVLSEVDGPGNDRWTQGDPQGKSDKNE